MLREWLYTATTRDSLGNTSPEDREISRVRGFCTHREIYRSLGDVFPNASFLSAVYAEHPKQTHCLVHQPSGNQHCTTLSKLCVYLRNNCTTRFVYHFNKLGRVKTSLQALKLRKFETLLTE